MKSPTRAPDAGASTSPESDTRTARSAWLALGASGLALALLSWWLLRAQGQIGANSWFLKPQPAWPSGAWWLPLSALLIFGGLGVSCGYDRFYRANSKREGQASIWLALGALMLLSLVWNWSLLGPPRFNVRRESRTGFFMVLASSWSDVATEYLGTAYQIEGAREFSIRYASDWQRQRPVSIAHVATHPPGATLFYFACRRAVEGSPALREWLLGLAERGSELDRVTLARELNEMRQSAAFSGGVTDSKDLPVEAIATALLVSALLGAAPALAVPALWMLGSLGASASGASGWESRAFRRAQGRGAVAAGLWILAPTTGLFAPTLDALVALGAAWTLALATRHLSSPPERELHSAQPSEPPKYLWLLDGAHGGLFGAGAMLALTAFVSFGALTIGLALALWLLLERRLRGLAWLVLGALAGEAVLLLLFPHSPPQVFARAMQAHSQATLSHRSYVSWLGLNPLMFALFAGWPVVVGAARGLALKLHPTGEVCDAGLEHLKRLGLAVLGAMLLISLRGTVRGEVERLWMFLLPPFCALAAASWLPLQGGPRKSKFALVGLVALLAVALQAAQSLVMAATLAPLVRAW